MREMSVAEQRYKAVLAVIGDGRAVSEVQCGNGAATVQQYADIRG